jgi:hypothetical protein
MVFEDKKHGKENRMLTKSVLSFVNHVRVVLSLKLT